MSRAINTDRYLYEVHGSAWKRLIDERQQARVVHDSQLLLVVRPSLSLVEDLRVGHAGVASDRWVRVVGILFVLVVAKVGNQVLTIDTERKDYMHC
jgi:hypothetical protein